MVPLGSLINVWYKSIENFDFNWYKYEKFRRDSMAESWRLKKYPADTIKYLIDSFNFILKNRQFSYDPELRAQDMELLFRDLTKGDSLDLDFLLDDGFDYLLDDNEIDTSYFYDE